jgi:hypothetical protein
MHGTKSLKAIPNVPYIRIIQELGIFLSPLNTVIPN